MLLRCARLSAELQLVDNIAAFKPAEGKRPLMLLPGRPPKPLALEHALMSSGAVKEGQKTVGGLPFQGETGLGAGLLRCLPPCIQLCHLLAACRSSWPSPSRRLSCCPAPPSRRCRTTTTQPCSGVCVVVFVAAAAAALPPPAPGCHLLSPPRLNCTSPRSP